MNYTDEQVFEKVRTIIAGVLRISPGEVKLDSVLTEELGMESLDFVDIQFQLEKEFKIRFYAGSVVEKLAEIFGNDSIYHNERLTELGAQVLQKRMPEIDSSRFVAGMSIAGVEQVYTTKTWVRVVKELLESKPNTQEEVLEEWAKSISQLLTNA